MKLNIDLERPDDYPTQIRRRPVYGLAAWAFWISVIATAWQSLPVAIELLNNPMEGKPW